MTVTIKCETSPLLLTIVETESCCNSNVMISVPQLQINMQLHLIDV